MATSRILTYSARGAPVGELAMPANPGRVAYAPDGYLYYLVLGWPTPAEVQRFELPSSL